MKKVLALVMVLALALSFTACGGSGKKVKTGIAIVSSLSGTNASADESGLAQVDSTVAAVTVDESGKIVSCKIDVAQNKVPVNADGSFDTSLTFKSKQELGTDYGMTPASPIGKEWNEQADAFATLSPLTLLARPLLRSRPSALWASTALPTWPTWLLPAP